MAAVVAEVDEMSEIDPQDTRHPFWEEMKRLFFAMREVNLEDLDEEMLEEFMSAMNQIPNVLFRIEKRQKAREK